MRIHLLSTLLLWAAPLVGAAADRPHIVFILADDLGYGDVGCFNPDAKFSTPNLDQLATEGMRFTDAHSPGSVCVPTRYGLLTGRYPYRGDLRSNPKIRSDRPTIASLLKSNGYATAMVGKWHLGFEASPANDWSQPLRGGPLDRGFDRYFGIPASLDIPPYYYIRDRHPVAPPTDQIEARNTEGWTPIQGEFWRAGGIAPGFKHHEVLPKFGDEAIQMIDDHPKGDNSPPLFLYVALTAPHTPWLPLQDYQGKSSAGMYGDFVMQVDATVGQILAALQRHEMAEDTLVIFTSDNGPVWFPQDIERFDHRSSGQLSGIKGDAWEGGHRMPFIARWPNRTPAGSECDQTICFTDMMATFAALVDDMPPSDTTLDSYNILPLLHGNTPSPPIRNITIHKRNASAIRMGKWKLITHRGPGGMSNRYGNREEPEEDANGIEGQLYDLSTDIGESTNLWADRPEVVQRLTAALEAVKRGNPQDQIEAKRNDTTVPRVFPSAHWSTIEASRLDLDHAKLDALAERMGGRGCVIKHGYIVKSWGQQDEISDWYSSAKPVLSTLLMFAVKEAKVASFDTRLAELGWALKAKDQSMTLRHLANMNSGYARPDRPGSAWAYNDFAIQLYQRSLFDRIYREDPATVANSAEHLGALGLEDGLEFRKKNRRLSASVRDFARITWFWLNRGYWDGKQLLPRQYFDDNMRPQTAVDLPHTQSADTDDYLQIGSFGGGSDHFTHFGAGIYGFNWWYNDTGRLHPNSPAWPDAPSDLVMSIGYGGNCTAISPIQDAILVAAKANWGTLEAGNQDSDLNQVLKQFAESVTPHESTAQ